MNVSIKKNFFYSSLLTVSGYVFSFITFPYVSRILGVSNMGLYNFVDGVVNYSILISMLGVNSVGIREMAKNKFDKPLLEESFWEIFSLNALFTAVALLGLLTMTFTIDKFYLQRELMLIGAVKLVFNFLMIEWFFKGIEDFKYVTIRSILIKVIYVVLVFLLIKNSEDYIIFYFLTVLSIVFNVFFNWKYLLGIIKIRLKNIQYKKYLMPVLTLGCYMLLTSMYTTFNIVYLGFVGGEVEVGYYTTATKLYSVLLALFTTFTGVMLPRMSALIAKGEIEEFKRITHKSYDVLFGFSFPIVILSMFFAPEIIQLIAGKGYEGAILPMRIVMPLMIIIGYEQILVLQILMPLKKDRAILINSIIGASVGLIANLLIVPLFGSTGSSIVWVLSEFVVLISAQIFVTKYIGVVFPFKKIGLHVVIALPAISLCLFFRYFSFDHLLINSIALFGLIFIYYLFIQIKILKNDLLIDFIKRFYK